MKDGRFDMVGSGRAALVGVDSWDGCEEDGSAPVMMSASQSPTPPGAQSMAVWGEYTCGRVKMCMAERNRGAYTDSGGGKAKKGLLLCVGQGQSFEATKDDGIF